MGCTAGAALQRYDKKSNWPVMFDAVQLLCSEKSITFVLQKQSNYSTVFAVRHRNMITTKSGTTCF